MIAVKMSAAQARKMKKMAQAQVAYWTAQLERADATLRQSATPKARKVKGVAAKKKAKALVKSRKAKAKARSPKPVVMAHAAKRGKPNGHAHA